MPFDGGGMDITLPAAADFSAKQYRFVKLDANGRGTICTANTDIPIGILQNKPGAADRAMRVRIAGLSLFAFGAASNEGDLLTSNAEGFGTATTAASNWVGAITLMAPGGSGDIQEVMLFRQKLP